MAKNNVIKVDFSNVSEGGSFRIPAGEYVAKVKKVEKRVSESSGKPYLNWELEIISGDKNVKGKVIYHVTSLQPQALFNLRNVLIALGIDVPKKSINLDLSKLKGKVLGIVVEDDEYRGEDGRKVKKSVIIEVYPVKKGSGGKWEKLSMPGEEEFDEDTDDEEDLDEDEEDDDEDEDEDEDDDEDDDDEDDEDEDDEDDEDEDKPKTKKKSNKSSVKKTPAKKEKSKGKKKK